MERRALTAGASIALLAFSWAAPISGAALSSVLSLHERSRHSLRSPIHLTSLASAPAPARLREVKGRGLIVDVWLNQSGPYAFAVDTGAGITLISAQVADRARVGGNSEERVAVGGMSKTRISGRQTVVNQLSLGDATNTVAFARKVLIVPTLPQGIDGILDPTDAFAPVGYVIDIPGKQLRALDRSTRLKMGDEPPGGTVVRWIHQGSDIRPFVRLGDNRIALIDTGSGFALAVTGTVIGNNQNRRSVHDLTGGAFAIHKVAPTTVSIGSLVLRNVPTEVLVEARQDAPVILGRGALYPFKLTFDPASKLIEIAPAQ